MIARVLSAIAKFHFRRRSKLWPSVRHMHLMSEDWCRWCGGLDELEVHHVVPYHIDAAKELDLTNLITLCEHAETRCHLMHGHRGSWRDVEPQIRQFATAPRPTKPPV